MSVMAIGVFYQENIFPETVLMITQLPTLLATNKISHSLPHPLKCLILRQVTFWLNFQWIAYIEISSMIGPENEEKRPLPAHKSNTHLSPCRSTLQHPTPNPVNPVKSPPEANPALASAKRTPNYPPAPANSHRSRWSKPQPSPKSGSHRCSQSAPASLPPCHCRYQ
jgi:hypothetical protein